MERIKLAHREDPDPAILERAAGILARGGVVIYPTETLYALGCDPRSAAALQNLARLKRRPAALRLPLIAADRAQVESVVRFDTSRARELADHFWPGPLTLVLPRREDANLAPWPWGLTLAVRVPGSAPARRLAGALGSPLPSTSANLSGLPAPATIAGLLPELLSGADLLLDAGALPSSLPSSIVQVGASSWRLLREGAVPLSDLIARLGPPESGPLKAAD